MLRTALGLDAAPHEAPFTRIPPATRGAKYIEDYAYAPQNIAKKLQDELGDRATQRCAPSKALDAWFLACPLRPGPHSTRDAVERSSDIAWHEFITAHPRVKSTGLLRARLRLLTMAPHAGTSAIL
jgi:hypothetical protein